MDNTPTLEQAIEWNNSDEQLCYVMSNFNVFSCDYPEYCRLENAMDALLTAKGIELK